MHSPESSGSLPRATQHRKRQNGGRPAVRACLRGKAHQQTLLGVTGCQALPSSPGSGDHGPSAPMLCPAETGDHTPEVIWSRGHMVAPGAMEGGEQFARRSGEGSADLERHLGCAGTRWGHGLGRGAVDAGAGRLAGRRGAARQRLDPEARRRVTAGSPWALGPSLLQARLLQGSLGPPAVPPLSPTGRWPGIKHMQWPPWAGRWAQAAPQTVGRTGGPCAGVSSCCSMVNVRVHSQRDTVLLVCGPGLSTRLERALLGAHVALGAWPVRAGGVGWSGPREPEARRGRGSQEPGRVPREHSGHGGRFFPGCADTSCAEARLVV